MSELQHLMDQSVLVVTNDARVIVGTLKGFDQTLNVILGEAHERIFSLAHGVELMSLGLYIVRGDNIALIGELDDDLDRTLDFDNITAAPLRPVVH